jgi:NitT/TauT family transport system substrate-binding protein
MQRRSSVLLAALMLLMAGCGGAPQASQPAAPSAPAAPSSAPSQPPSLTPVTLGVLKLNSSAPIFVGLDKGYFRDAGIDPQVKWFTAAEPVAVAVASGDVQVGATGLTAGLYNLIGSGKKMLIVADKGREEKGYHLDAVLVRPDAGITRVEDLKGRSVGMTQVGSTFHYMLGNILARHGLALSDVHVKAFGSLNNVAAALQGRQVDAILISEPFVDKAVQAGYAKVLAWVSDEIPYQVAAIFYSPSFAAQHDLAVRFMQAYIRSVRAYYDACLKPGAGPATCDPVAAIVGKYTESQPSAVEQSLTYIDPSVQLIPGDIGRQIAWYKAQGMVTGNVDAAAVVDDGFRQEALRALGG